MKRKILLAVVFTAFFATTAMCMEILPVSYTFDKSTSSNYTDWSGKQLTDGQYGVSPYWANLGSGRSYEWVGWVAKPVVNIDFDFGLITQVDSIQIGSVQNSVYDVVFPSIRIYSSDDNAIWKLIAGLDTPESTTNNGIYKQFLFDNLRINTQFTRVSLLLSLDGPWTFVDEIDFFQNAIHAPEPSTFLLLGAGLIGLAGYAGIRRRKKV